MDPRKLLSLVLICALAATAAAAPPWRPVLAEDFNADPSANWTYSGVLSGGPLLCWNAAAGRIEAEWDQSNCYVGTGDPQTIQPSRYSRPLGVTLTDGDTFRVGATLVVNSVADTEEFYQVANFGLYGLAHMGADRTMSDNWSGNANLVKDGSDFVEFNYFINNDSWGFNSTTQATIGAHISGVDGDYTTGSGISGDPLWHGTDMGADHWLPTGTPLYVEVTYYGRTTRRAHSAIYTDPARTTLLAVSGVQQYYWTMPLPAEDHFAVTDVAMWNYVAANWGGVNGAGAGSFDDVYVQVAAIPGDADLNGYVDLPDLIVLARNWHLDPAGWADGNFDDDTAVELADLVILARHWRQGTPPGGASVPEPATAAVLLAGLAGLVTRARRR